jgi:hypothetical protein
MMGLMSMIRAIRLAILRWMIVEAVPFLNRFRKRAKWDHSVDELRQFPENSWGANLALFLDSRGFADFLPNYASHDAIHTLLGYETDVVGEMRLQAFMIGNRGASFAGHVMFVLGCLLLPELWSQLRLDYARGRQSPSIRHWHIPALLTTQLNHLSSQLAPRNDRSRS